MFKSVFILSLRSLIKNFSFTVITVSSLVVGITTAVLISIWIGYEINYDTQDPDANRVYAVLSNEMIDGEIQTQEETYAPIAELLSHEIPEVEAMTRIDNTLEQLTFEKTTVSKYGAFVDSMFFKVFPTEIIYGRRENPFPNNNSIAISDKLASLLFKETNAVGNIISLGLKGDFTVTQVYKAYEQNNSLNYINYVLPFDFIKRGETDWLNYFVKVNQTKNKSAVEAKIDKKFVEFYGNESVKSLLFSLKDWRLRWSFENGEISGGRITYVYIFGITGLFILLMACINYMNIATARATKRSREIGVRKATGATQAVLIKQFLGESMLLSFLASTVSFFMAYLLLPLFRELTGIPLQLDLFHPITVVCWLGISLLTGIMAGIYPAFLLSSFKPVIALKGNSNNTLVGSGIRKVLVIFQFALSTIMIFGALILWKQTDYLLNKEVGYDKSNVLNIWLPSDLNLPLESFKNEITSLSSVKSAALSGASPMEVNGYADVKWAGMPINTPFYLYGASIGFDMLSTLNFKIIKGRNFSKELLSDSSNYVITKKAAELLGFENPIGQQITYTMFGDRKGEIIGVIDDFNNDNIHLPIAPVLFFIGKKGELNNMFVKYEQGKQDIVLEEVKAVYNKFLPGIAMNYSFLELDYKDQLYQEEFLRKLSFTFTILAVVISCLGMLGLTLFNTERRTKEIGIRKVLGASVYQVLTLLIRDLLRPLIMAFTIGFPVAYWIMDKYLEGFPFSISIDLSAFVIVTCLLVGVILLVVSHQSFRAAVKNPVDSLKTE